MVNASPVESEFERFQVAPWLCLPRSGCERGRQWRKALVLLSEMDTLSIEQDLLVPPIPAISHPQNKKLHGDMTHPVDPHASGLLL